MYSITRITVHIIIIMFFRTIRYVQKIVLKRFQQMPLPLGRWGHISCPKQVDNKVDWSNEDHCGPCGEKVLAKKKYESNSSENNSIKK